MAGVLLILILFAIFVVNRLLFITKEIYLLKERVSVIETKLER